MVVKCIDQMVLEPLRECKETQKLLKKHGDEFDDWLRKLLNQGRTQCDSLLMARYYSYCYQLMHHDAFRHVLSKHTKLIQRNVLDHNGDLLIVDFGCGPLTSGLAIGSYAMSTIKKPLNGRYAGIDDCDAMLDLAMEFETCPVFGDGFETRYANDWNADDVPGLVEYADKASSLVLCFSYLFGQPRALNKMKRLANFCKELLIGLRPEDATLIYLNTTHFGADLNWNRFAGFMDIPSEDSRDWYDFRYFRGLDPSPIDFPDNRANPSLAYSVLKLDWRQYAESEPV